MNENLMFDFLMQNAAMRPEEEQLARKQKMIDALRQQSMEGPQGQIVSGHYVAPSLTQYAAQMANAYGARKGQEAIDDKSGRMQADLLRDLERKRRQSDPALYMNSLRQPIQIAPQDFSWMQTPPQAF